MNFLKSLAIALCLFSGAIEAQSVDATRQVVKIALAQEPPQLNSMKATDQVSIFVLGHVMEGLTRYDRRGNLAPGVAERWTLSATSAKFWLRKDAKWSNGDPVTAHDFVFAWRNAVDPKTASEYAFILYPVKNAEAINQGNLPITDLGIRALDDHTLEVTLERPTGYFMKLTAFVTTFPVQERFYRSVEASYAADASQMLYNGAFKITDWVHSASLKMQQNETVPFSTLVATRRPRSPKDGALVHSSGDKNNGCWRPLVHTAVWAHIHRRSLEAVA